MAAHRYWRIRFRPSSGLQGRCAELQLRTSIGGPSVATGGTPAASSASGANVAANAFDGNPATFWLSTNVAQSWFIGYDFGAGNEKDIVEAAWTAHSASVAQNPVEWWLEWSDDNLAWVVVAYDNFMPAWTASSTRTVNTTIGNGDSASVSTTIHSVVASRARASGVWATVHCSIASSSQAIANGLYAVVHTSIKDLPVGLLPVRPDAPVVERLSWMTDVIQNYDGTDQRISIRLKPRRELTYSMTFVDDADYRRAYDMYYNGAGSAIHAPVWGYSARIKSSAAIGATTIYCNTYRGDFRPNDPVLLATPSGEKHVYYIQDVFLDRIVIGRPLSVAIPAGTWAVPCSRARFSATPSFEMNSISGTSNMTVRAERPRDQEAWPYKPVALPTFDGYVIVDRRPTNAPAGHEFDKNVEVIDDDTGIEKYVTSWRQTYVEGAREYMVNTLWAWDELQFWRTLFDYCCGRQKSFLTPTYRQDLVPVSLSASGIVVEGKMYDVLYKNSNTYRRFQIETEAGTVNVKADSVSVNGDGNTVITFTLPIPSGISQAKVKRVSYLNLVRLGGDSVTITHEETRAMIGLSLRTATE